MLEFFLGPTNPTTDWQRASDLRLTFDLKGSKLNGVGFGEPLNRLSFLGPIEDRSGLTLGEYRFFSLGLSVDCYNEQDTIDCFEIVQKDQDMPEHQPFPGVCRSEGENLIWGNSPKSHSLESSARRFGRTQTMRKASCSMSFQVGNGRWSLPWTER